MHVQDHLTLDELQRVAKAITDKRTWLRFQAVILASQGHPAPEIAQALGISVVRPTLWPRGRVIKAGRGAKRHGCLAECERVAAGRHAEHAPVFAAELRGAVVADGEADAGDVAGWARSRSLPSLDFPRPQQCPAY